MAQQLPMCTDVVLANTHGLATTWYPPVLGGAKTLAQDLFHAPVYNGVMDILKKLKGDDYSSFLIQFMERGLATYGQTWRYADICTVLYALSKRLGVSDYLEIGVRQGRSLAMVAATSPTANIVGFDLWLKNYAGMDNPGPNFVHKEMHNVGYTGHLHFVSGNSHETVPRYFEAYPEATFDLITVDGDHSPEGAMQDLLTVLPRLRIGGALVFDDIVHPKHTYLADIWNRAIASRPNFSTFAFTDLGYGVAFAIRRS